MRAQMTQRREQTMIGRLNHVAIAVRDLDAACAIYRDTLGATITEPLPQPEPTAVLPPRTCADDPRLCTPAPEPTIGGPLT